MKHLNKTLQTLLLCLLVVATTPAQQQTKVRIDLRETKLKNGLRVVTVEDHHAPVVSLVLIYNVGGANERKGRGEFAHLFEHLMFQGTRNIEPGEFNKLVGQTGGIVNATVNDDRTVYFEVVPADQLELPLFLESDRLRGLSITQQRLDIGRKAVQEERRMRILNQPYGRSGEVMTELLYDNFAYKHGGMESMEGLDAASLEDIQDFFKTYYAPNNAVLALVGDFKTVEALAKIRKYFEDIPRQPEPSPIDFTEAEQKAERRKTIEDALAPLPQVRIAFKAVPGNTPDFYALQILSAVLQDGQSSRLYQKLVKEKELVNGVGGGIGEKRGPAAFSITTTLRQGKKVETVEAAIYEEFERLKREPITNLEIEKAKNSINGAFINNLERSLIRAITVAQYAIFYDDPNLINTRLDKTNSVTREDVRRVANKYLKPTNRTVVVTVPKAATDKTAK
ncbi:MAG: insulinase family protein [Pyrinomonadaceae bacterium]|nr:insulinase family protein [Pyrinomonadaceae bacterium]